MKALQIIISIVVVVLIAVTVVQQGQIQDLNTEIRWLKADMSRLADIEMELAENELKRQYAARQMAMYWSLSSALHHIPLVGDPDHYKALWEESQETYLELRDDYWDLMLEKVALLRRL